MYLGFAGSLAESGALYVSTATVPPVASSTQTDLIGRGFRRAAPFPHVAIVPHADKNRPSMNCGAIPVAVGFRCWLEREPRLRILAA
jgi:hypothetical protein